MDELNHDFQALALEGRVMGEVRIHITHLLYHVKFLCVWLFFFLIYTTNNIKHFVAPAAAPHRKEILGN